MAVVRKDEPTGRHFHAPSVRDFRLVTAARPVLATARTLLSGTEQSLVLCNAAGVVLCREADPTVQGSADEVALIPGADWSEQSVGTNALGKALAEQRIAAVTGTQHQLAILHEWAGAAAPIQDPVSGQLAGLLGIYGRHMTVTGHTELAVQGIAAAIAARLSSQGSAATPHREAHRPAPAVGGLVGTNPAWILALERAARVALRDSTLLITGETGTGKEVLARAVHRAGQRPDGPFVAVNCGALPPALAASELFGYVGGAFTGANPRGAVGKIEAANGGTLFLDEISELPPEAQVYLLRVLEQREVVRVGGHTPVPFTGRVIAATNRSIPELVAKGTFRPDLFFRLNVVPIHLPPLRERREDILPLIEHAYDRMGVAVPDLGLSSWERLTAYAWPGNVRELLNLVEHAVVMGEDPADLLPLPPLKAAPEPLLGLADGDEPIRQALAKAGGNAAEAARLLGISRSTLYRKLELYGIRLGRQIE